MKLFKNSIIAMAFSLSLSSLAQYNATVETILENLHGCFEVTYNFVEDGPHDKNYLPIYEWIRTDHKDGKKIYEHIGQYPNRNPDGTPILDNQGNPTFFSQYHWREEWLDLGSNQWQQSIIGPFNDFRYSCQSSWTMNQFHCHTGRAARPRRDRNRDYEYMTRINTLQINPEQWVHGQRNKKFKEDSSLFSIELGWNTYKRVDNSICQPAIDAHPMPLEN